MERIIAGVDFSPSSEEAARQACELAEATGAHLHLVTATRKAAAHTVSGGGETWTIDDVERAQSKLAALAGQLVPGRPVTCAVLEGDAAKAIVAEAERIGADVIVVGNRRVNGVSRVLGAVAIDIVRQAPCAVHIVKTS